MSLIDQTYFTGRLNIPNSDKDFVLERLQYFIDDLEPKFLTDLFGYPLYSLLAVEMQAEEDDSLSSYSTRFDRLINGYEYTRQDTRLHKWNGLFFIRDSVKVSLIANYIYWHWLKDQNSQTTGLGENATQAQNATLVSPTIKMNQVWNEMSDMVQQLYCFMQSNRNDYQEWTESNWVYRKRLFAPQNQFGI